MTSQRSRRTLGAADKEFSRRSFLGASGGMLALGASGFGAASLGTVLASRAAELKRQGMACILLWMQGGPSQLETFDPKPEHENGGPTGVISTSVPGVHIAEHWTEVATVMDQLAVIRSMTNREGNHQRATYQLHTGYPPLGAVKYPTFGSVVAREVGTPEGELPPFVVLGAGRRRVGLGAGFLGVAYEPLAAARPGRPPENTELPVETDRFTRRLGLLRRLEDELATDESAAARVREHQELYAGASRLARSPKLGAFDLESEASEVRAAYGDNAFGQSCLLARRLVEAGVTFVEVRSGGWDTHQQNFDRVKKLSGGVDRGFAQLIRDLRDRDRLKKTLVVWMGEFGRTPRINPRVGRDHYPRAFNAVMAGGGIVGGQVVGSTTDDGREVRERPVTVPDLFCTFCHALGVDPRHENYNALGRPIKIVEGGSVVNELFT